MKIPKNPKGGPLEKKFYTNFDKCLELHETQSKLKSLEVNFLAACKCDPSWDLENFEKVDRFEAALDPPWYYVQSSDKVTYNIL